MSSDAGSKTDLASAWDTSASSAEGGLLRQGEALVLLWWLLHRNL